MSSRLGWRWLLKQRFRSALIRRFCTWVAGGCVTDYGPLSCVIQQTTKCCFFHANTPRRVGKSPERDERHLEGWHSCTESDKHPRWTGHLFVVKIARICRRNLPAHDTRLGNNNRWNDHRDISIKCGVGKVSRMKRGYANGRSTFPVVKYGVKVIRDGIGSNLLCLWLVALWARWQTHQGLEPCPVQKHGHLPGLFQHND